MIGKSLADYKRKGTGIPYIVDSFYFLCVMVEMKKSKVRVCYQN
jgi:hypothetical protein